MSRILLAPTATATDDPEDWELLAGLFGGGSDAHDVQLALIERYTTGQTEFGFLDRVFRANGWEWPQL